MSAGESVKVKKLLMPRDKEQNEDYDWKGGLNTFNSKIEF